ncbi:MAG TPA: 6-phosphogluconolactonase [Trichormus sp.]|jgi:6-phosphogluconolactonase
MTVLEIKETTINVSENADELVHNLANRFCELAREAIAARNNFAVALSGGSTPKALYETLATPEYRGQIDWTKVLLFLGDERCVPHSSSDSNFNMVTQALLSKLEIPDSHVFSTEGQDKDPEAAAKHYEERIRRAFGSHSDVPKFDLILLGLGPDGHTASLFPDSAALKEKQKLFVANFAPKMQAWRMTITFPVINNGLNVYFLVSGESKAAIVADIFTSQSKKYPAQFVQPEGGKLEWWMDQPAAARLTKG